jgi:condensin complex subunit 2
LSAEAGANSSANKSKQKEKREPFKIDFLTPSTRSQKELAKEIFAPAKTSASITLPQLSKKRGKKGREKRSEQTLPDDMHFSSRQLVTLFLKPKFAVCALTFLSKAYFHTFLAD